MITFIIGLIVGLFIGAAIGFIGAAFCAAAKERDKGIDE